MYKFDTLDSEFLFPVLFMIHLSTRRTTAVRCE